MIAALLLAAASLPLGVWPGETGPPMTVIGEVEFYAAEPEEPYWIIAVQPLTPPLAAGQQARLARLAATATRLGVDAVLLLGELPESAIPEDPEEPLDPTERFSVAVFVSFEGASEEDSPRVAVVSPGGAVPWLSPAGTGTAHRQASRRQQQEDPRLHHGLGLDRGGGQADHQKRRPDEADAGVHGAHHPGGAPAGGLGVLPEGAGKGH